MKFVLKDKTNSKENAEMNLKKKEVKNEEKQKVLNVMRNVYETTRDYSFKYDLGKCIEIIEGKENQEVCELKVALIDALEENELLFDEKCKLIVENDYLKDILKNSK
ncbi:DUF5101 domain-containing protein [Hamiltosporidium tvaerminnensis]|uniref:DUF5101 domain-containing protein n=2 Tax=Hamiltosporidium TaxID=1176354 RepID=A0A4Q9LD16_9MICR|nr:DUF5101 domain-containing protein [Hamiltosporidium tvaerminnensis]TBU03217.1 DUF5101 domain-containing protein [Hamiltosporidium magnivora]TBU05787.1 DUF5101 domain-containing protein [Hamiltosporidium magnivora]TBU11880.1 DUF5101 domain-containing protein [Hamiltosporidium tvaerminnensis]